MKSLKQYIPIGARHKLLFTSHYAEGMNFADNGHRTALIYNNQVENTLCF
jgi:hypothetical protein